MFLSMGQEHTYKVPLEMFQENRTKLWTNLQKEKNGTKQQSIVVLQGGEAQTRYDSDHEPLFRQESYFWWLTGVKDPDCWVVLMDNDNSNNKSPKCILFIPKLPAEYATIMGKIKTPNEWKQLYQVDQVEYTDDLETFLQTQTSSAKSTIYLMHGLNTDSDNMYPAPQRILDMHLDKKRKQQPSENGDTTMTNGDNGGSDTTVIVDQTTLFPIFVECRVFKSKTELKLLEHVSQISSFAHAYVMRNTKPGMYEYQCESLFLHYAYYNYGSRLVSYTSICGCGPNAAVLHYGHAGEPNSRQLREHDNCLFDMGAEYQHYASDITCSFPANGKFSDKYKPIYQAVLNAQIAVYNMAKPGVSWVDCHKAAEAEIIRVLMDIGLVVVPDGDKTIMELVELRLGAVFMPHGLGHFLGIDTHDVGGYLPGNPERIPLPGLKKLRTARILQENMVLTVEPGCYFIDHLLDSAYEDATLSPYLRRDKIEPYRGYGGVRLEDVVAITSDGMVNFTICPRTVEEVESVMAGGNWPPTKDVAPELRRVNLTADPTILLGPQPAPPST